MRVLHVGNLPLDKMGVITRMLVERCQGEHSYWCIETGPLDYVADVVVLHCFKKHWQFFYNFKRRCGEKIVSLVHSTPPCHPAMVSDRVVALSHYSAWLIEKDHRYMPIDVIPGAIYPHVVEPHAHLGMTFGRICRNADGKLHPKWNDVAQDVLEAEPESKLRLFTDDADGLLQHLRASYPHDLHISTDIEAKLSRLRTLNVGVIANGSFEETFSVEALELMAAGIPLVYLYQPALIETIGSAGLCCSSMDEVKETLIGLLQDGILQRTMSFDSLFRSCHFSADAMIKAWDQLLTEVAS